MQNCLVPLSLQGAAFKLPFFSDVFSFMSGHMLYQATRALLQHRCSKKGAHFLQRCRFDVNFAFTVELFREANKI